MKFQLLGLAIVVLKLIDTIAVGIDVTNLDINYDITGDELPERPGVNDVLGHSEEGSDTSSERAHDATDETVTQKRPWAELDNVTPEEIFLIFTQAPQKTSRHSNKSKNSSPEKIQEKIHHDHQLHVDNINTQINKSVSNKSEEVPERGGFVVGVSQPNKGDPIVFNPEENENDKSSSKETISKEFIPLADDSSKEVGGASLMEDSGEIETAMEAPLTAHIRVVRQAKTVASLTCAGESFSGDIIIGVDVIVNKNLTTNESTEGNVQNQQLKMDMADALKTVLEPFVNKDFKGVNFTLDINVTNIRSDGHVLFDIAVVDNVTGNCLSGSVDTEVRKSLAGALIDLQRHPRLELGGVLIDISDPLMESNKPPANQLVSAVCVLCSTHHVCTKRSNNVYYCRFVESEFFEFGELQSDERMPRDDEFATKKITIDSSFPYGSQLSDTIYISVNGLLSVGKENSSFSPARMPVPNQSLLAVYWTDLDLVTGDEMAEIFYQLYKKENPSDKAKEILRAANAEVVSRSNEKKSYDAMSVLVVTWVEVPADSSSYERVSFQCVVITDGETTYVLYIYSNRNMNFEKGMARPVEVGWGSVNLDPKRSSYYEIDQLTSNTGGPGRWFFKVGEKENFKMKCLNWYRANVNDLPEVNRNNGLIPPCPCNEFAAFASGLWLRSQENERCYDVIPIYGEYGRRCCYRRDGSFSFENRRPLAGSLQRYNSLGRQLGNHVINDVIPKRWCCDQSDLCDLYYTLRPTRSCVATEWARALLFGDPHVITLDQEAYIFNGEGVYRILEITDKDVDFNMQGRTCRAVGSSGNLTDATIWCGLAMISTNKDTMRISMNDNSTRMIIYANNQDYSLRYYSEQQFNASVNGTILRKINDTLQISTSDSVAVNVTLINKLLEFSVVLDTKYKNKTRGLLGNFNDNKADDYQFPDGRKPLSPNATERDKFYFGKAWAITDITGSLFKLEYGQNLTAGTDFVPQFLDEADPTLRNEAQQVCDSNNIPCVYDYIATRNTELAKTSGKSADDQVIIHNTVSNNAPIVSNASTINVKLNGTFNINLTAYDPDGDNVSVVFVDGSHDSQSCVIQQRNLNCHLELRSTEIITIAVVDQKRLQSEIVTIPIVVCSCSSHGHCNFNVTRKTSRTGYDLATCECDTGYSGLECDQNKDGCAYQPCPQDTGCLDKTPEEEASTGLAYTCTNCPAGFLLNSNKTKCEDINECYNTSVLVCGANGDCNNIIGSFRCICHEGFRLIKNSLCVDIDECNENTHQCNQKCVNTKGSYFCECEPGFQTNDDKFNCVKLNDTRDHCEKLNKTCEYGCRNSTAECFCQRGKKLKKDGQSCEDIDECETPVCSQNCNNTDGNFFCSCYNGYELNADRTTCDSAYNKLTS